MELIKRLGLWISLARPPFHSVGILPFVLGTVLGFRAAGKFDEAVFFWGLTAVVLIVLSTYYNGEAHDTEEDSFCAARFGKNIYSGGSHVVIRGMVPLKNVKIAGYLTVVSALLIGFLLQFGYKTGPLTLPLGLTGVVCGFYYSKPPFRWVKRGLGELFIAYSYGWLPIAVGFYLQTAGFHELIKWIFLPIACTIFNVVFINEFLDYSGDCAAGKKNLAVRLGMERAALLYVLITVTAVITFAFSLTRSIINPLTFLFYLPVAALSTAVILMMLRRQYENRVLLQRVCLMTILINIGTSLAYILGVIL